MKDLIIENKDKLLSFYKGEGIGSILSEYCYDLIEYITAKLDLRIETELIETLDQVETICEYYDRVKDKNGVIISGPVSGSKVYELREKLGLLFKIIEIKPSSFAPRFTPLKSELLENTDILVLRENLDGPYYANFGQKDQLLTAEVIYSTLRIQACANLAFELANKRNKQITLVGKEDVSGILYNYWIDSFASSQKKYPAVKFSFINIDRFISDVLLDSYNFDVVVAPNSEADAFTDVLVECFCGSRNNGCSINFNEQGSFFVTQTIHGSGREIINWDKINPIGHINATIAALRCINEIETAKKLNIALENVVKSINYYNPHDADVNNVDLSTFFKLIKKTFDE